MPCPTQLLADLKSVKKLSQNHKKFIKLVSKEKYSTALLFGCENCSPTDTVQLNLISILLKYKDSIALDLNLKDKNEMYPLSHALKNKNFSLFELLQKAGAADDIRLKNNNPIKLQCIIDLIREKSSQEFQKDEETLRTLYRALPSKAVFKNDEENACFDAKRIDFLLKTLNHLIKHFQVVNDNNLDSLSISLPPDISQNQLKQAKNTSPMFAREHFTNICTTIQNLSTKLRDRYASHFSPSPFTWYTFERLGGIIGSQYSKRVIEISSNGFGSTSNNFLAELIGSGNICDEALVSIVKLDVPLLSQFFAEIKKEHTEAALPNAPVNVRPIQLIATRALLNRIGDNMTILELTKLTANFRRPKPTHAIYHTLMEKTVFIHRPDNSDYSGHINLSTKVGRHAALNLVFAVGELCGGKNLSKDIRKVDKTINWQALVLLRDVLAHPEERDNYRKIQALLINDSEVLLKIICEIRNLNYRLPLLMTQRTARTGICGQDFKSYWHIILNEFIKQLAAKKAEAAIEVKRRVSQEDEDLIINAFRADAPPEEVLKYRLEWRAIFDGSKELPEKSFISETKKYLISRKENRELFNKCTDILESAFPSHDPTTKEERIQLMAEQEEERRKAKESAFKGLDTIRNLVHITSTICKQEYYLTPLKHIEAALESINNIEEFLIEAGYLHANGVFKTLEEWDTFNHSRNLPALNSLLLSNTQLNDAIELNARFILRFLEVIRKYEESQISNLLTKHYHVVKGITIYLAHGDSLTDPSGFNYDKFRTPLEHRHRHTLPVLFRLIYELRPDLERMVKMLKAKEEKVSAPVSHGLFAHVSDRVEQNMGLLFLGGYSL